jgi:hypothetical protein
MRPVAGGRSRQIPYVCTPRILRLSAFHSPQAKQGISESRFGKVMVPRMGDGETVEAGWGSVLCVHREIHEGERSDVGEFKPHSACCRRGAARR